MLAVDLSTGDVDGQAVVAWRGDSSLADIPGFASHLAGPATSQAPNAPAAARRVTRREMVPQGDGHSVSADLSVAMMCRELLFRRHRLRARNARRAGRRIASGCAPGIADG